MNISVIIPVYKVEPYIERCLRSIMNQTFTDGVECIIVNDCSPDNSIKIAKKLISEYNGDILFKIISHVHNRGIAATRNTGLKVAKGIYVQHIDGDDYAESTMLEELYKEALKTDADIIFADYWITYKDYEEYTHQYFTSSKQEMVNLILRNKISVGIWDKMFKRELYTKNNIQCIEGANMAEDFRSYLYLMLAAKKITQVKQAFIHYVKFNESSYTYQTSPKKLLDEIINTTEITNYIKSSEPLFDTYKNAVYNRELILKLKLLLHSKGPLQKEWNNLYKDADKEIFNNASYSKYWALALWGASHGWLPWFNAFRFVWIKLKRNPIAIFNKL